MKYKIILILLLIGISCNNQYSKPLYVVSTYPIAEIIREIVGTKGEVISLTQPGDSPHTYTPKPSDMQKALSAKAVFYVSDKLDSWAMKLENKNRISLINLLPKENLVYFEGEQSCTEEDHKEHHHHAGEIDPHFWTDPLTVKALVPMIVDTLSKIDPQNAQSYQNNAQAFMKRLDLLNRQVESLLVNQKGKTLFLFHPSFLYFAKRYQLNYGGSIEVSPGKEPTANYLVNLVKKIQACGARSIFSEPQLPQASAKSIAEAAGVLLFVLDPIGGVEGRMKYADIILYNAKILQKAL
jgi:zinc transport system substrate-binding protein